MNLRGLLFISALCILARTTPAAGSDAALERLENGWYSAAFPIPVLHVEGSIEEVARGHGALLARHPEGRETLDYFANTVSRKLDGAGALARFPSVRTVLKWTYHHFIRNLLLDYMPERYREAYAEFAKAAGYDEQRLLDALVVPDAGLRLLGLLYNTELAPAFASNFGCSSVIWNSGPGTVLHGRNLDYDGVGYWDAHPLIMHVIPSEGQAYVSVTSLGMHAPGLTAFNESGLTLAVHQLSLSDVQSSGTPMVVISAEVIRNARSIDDAIAIIRGFPRAGSWAYVLSQGRDRAVVETSAGEVAIRRTSEPFFFQTNHVASPALAAEQIFASPGTWIDTFSRAGRLSRLVQAGATHSWATPDRLAPILGSGVVPGELNPSHRVAGGSIARLDNIQSVIMDASHRRLWVGVGTDRRAPNENTYVEYRWTDLRSADEPELTGAEVSVVPSDALGPANARLRETLRRAVNQKRAALSRNERSQALREYAGVAAPLLAGSDPARLKADAPGASGRWAGLYLYIWDELSRGQESSDAPEQLLRRLDVALHDADLAPPSTSLELTREAARHRLALGHLTRARLLDLLGRRSEALFEYYVVARTANFERLKKAAGRGLMRAFDWNQARDTAIDFAGIDLYRY